MQRMYEVAVIAPLTKSLTYSGPEKTSDELQPGLRVLVPLGRRFVTGYILKRLPDKNKDVTYVIKPIKEILDLEPVFPAEIIPFYKWIAEYYHFPIGEVVRTVLPGGLVSGSGRRIRLVEHHKADIQTDAAKMSKEDIKWVDRLLEKGELAPSLVATLYRRHSCRRLLRKWEQKSWVTIDDEINRKQFASKSLMHVELSESLRDVFVSIDVNDEDVFEKIAAEKFKDLKLSEIKTLKLLWAHFHNKKDTPLLRPDVTKQYSGAAKALKDLDQKQIISLRERRVYRDIFGHRHGFIKEPVKLTQEQNEVLEKLRPALESQVFKTFLLHGVTGCGKTEVYLQATAKALAGKKNVLILVPEIALASQLEAHFYSRFGERIALLHSGLTTAERHDQWQRILRGQAQIVLGARSAVFAPLPDLGLIIVDEEHEPAYKQEDGLHYHGRDLAVLRARFADCPVLLGSATPSLVSYHNAMCGKYELLKMQRRVHDQSLPDVSIVNLAEDKSSRPDLFFSDQLISALWENMENRQQSLLFVNRRGFASFMLCSDCGHIIQCRHCKVSLTLHRQENQLICHYCGYSISPRVICPDCGSKDIKALGIGSERIEEEVRQILPHARIARLDSDTATNRKQYIETLKAVYKKDIDVLIGTQMIAKGLHFPNLTLVGVVWADSGLAIPDFRSSERTFQLLAQVTGRAGRGEHPGRVIVQTYYPGHYSLRHAQQHDYEQFFAQEISLRRELNYPPFSRLVNIKLSSKNEKNVQQCAKAVGIFLRSLTAKKYRGVEILGPAPAPLVRIKDRTRWQVMIKSSQVSLLHALCVQLQEKCSDFCSRNVRMKIDVDPESMM